MFLLLFCKISMMHLLTEYYFSKLTITIRFYLVILLDLKLSYFYLTLWLNESKYLDLQQSCIYEEYIWDLHKTKCINIFIYYLTLLFNTILYVIYEFKLHLILYLYHDRSLISAERQYYRHQQLFTVVLSETTVA